MIDREELLRWLLTLEKDSGVAIDEGGLTVWEINALVERTGAYLEIGGIPQAEDEGS